VAGFHFCQSLQFSFEIKNTQSFIVTHFTPLIACSSAWVEQHMDTPVE
jgi:hypothetical protein